jgi:hypothetical protein
MKTIISGCNQNAPLMLSNAVHAAPTTNAHQGALGKLEIHSKRMKGL